MPGKSWSWLTVGRNMSSTPPKLASTASTKGVWRLMSLICPISKVLPSTNTATQTLLM